MQYACMGQDSLRDIPYSRKLLREKSFADFEVREPSVKVFFVEFGGVPHSPMVSFKQPMKVFSVKFSLPMDLRKFSPSSLLLYGICTYQS